MNRSHEHARMLLEKAGEDQYVLERLIDDPGSPDAAIGFHAQQAVEKSLKAVLTNRAIKYGRTHNLARLLDLLREHGIADPPQAGRLPDLTPYAAQLRYDRLPPEVEEPQVSVRAWVLNCVRQVMAWAASMAGQ